MPEHEDKLGDKEDAGSGASAGDGERIVTCVGGGGPAEAAAVMHGLCMSGLYGVSCQGY